jgi:hypothetical protein
VVFLAKNVFQKIRVGIKRRPCHKIIKLGSKLIRAGHENKARKKSHGWLARTTRKNAESGIRGKGIFASIAEFERELIRERVRSVSPWPALRASGSAARANR